MTEYLITFNDEWVQEHTEDEIKAKGVASRAVVREMQEQGVLLFTNGGLDADTAICSVVAEGGKPVFTDGPFVETKEHLGGYYIVDCKDLDRAIEIAAEIPDARLGGIEVRPIQEFPSDTSHG